MMTDSTNLTQTTISDPSAVIARDVRETHPASTLPHREERYAHGHAKEWLVGIIVALIGATSTIAAAVFETSWFPELVGFRSGDIHVTRTILYARILHFRDREDGAKPLQRRVLGLVGSRSRHEEDLYDEGLYVRAFYLKKHKSTAITLKAHSSGMVDITPIIPPTGNVVTEAYDKSDGKTLEYHLDIANKDYALVAHQYFNGYQYNRTNQRYESDGGMHIDHPTDEASLVFDFTGLDYSTALRGEPKAWMKVRSDEPARPIPATYQHGVLTTSPVMNPPIGSYIYCDWEWSTEPTA